MEGNLARDQTVGGGAVTRATLIGSTAVLMWGALALLTTWTGALPPFQLVAMAFAVAFALACAKWLFRGEDFRAHLRQPVSRNRFAQEPKAIFSTCGSGCLRAVVKRNFASSISCPPGSPT